MSCSRKHCSGCNHCRRGSFARVNYPYVSSCADHNSCNNCNSCQNNCCHCNSCNHSGCGCNHGCGASCNSCRNSDRSGWNNYNFSRYGYGRNYGSLPWRSYRGDNGFGLLRSVPDYRALRRYWGDNFPFYSGPCGPCANDCCNHCCCDCCNNGCDSCCSDNCEDCCDDCDCHPILPPLPPPDAPGCHAYAVFTAAAPIQLPSGGNISFSAANANQEGFSLESGGIRIENAGTYMVVYTVNVPANAAVSSRFALTLDGSSITASAMDITASADDGTGGNTMSAVIQADAGSLLNLNSLSPVNICPGPASSVFTLTIIAIC